MSFATEDRISLDQAAELLAIGGVAPTTKRVRNWCIAGVNGLRLEHGRIGKNYYTTREACARFIAAQVQQFIAQDAPRTEDETAELQEAGLL